MNHPLLGHNLPGPAPRFEARLRADNPAYLSDHRVYGLTIFPSAGYVEMGLAAARAAGLTTGTIDDYLIEQMLPLPEGATCPVEVRLTRETDLKTRFEVFSGSTRHAAGTVSGPMETPPAVNLSSLQHRCPEAVDVAAHYQACQERGIYHGPLSQLIEQLWRGERESLGRLQLGPTLQAEAGPYLVHPVLLDAALHVLGAAVPPPHQQQAYLSVGYRLAMHQPGATAAWVHARLVSLSETMLTADLQLFADDGSPILTVEGLLARRITPQMVLADAPSLSIAANFTADPIEPPLRFWLETLGLPDKIRFAPYNQVFQALLDPGSLLASHTNSANVLLLRLAEWGQPSLGPQVSPAEQDQLFSEGEWVSLPDGMVVASLNRYETVYLYKEIFARQAYLRHGLSLPEGACVIDAGANIGLFSLFVLAHCPTATLYAFEPAPPAFDCLKRNAAVYGPDRVRCFNQGLGAADGEAAFTVYPRSSVFSSFEADSATDEATIRAAVETALAQSAAAEESTDWLAGRLTAETHVRPVRRLSSLIQAEGLDRIDLLKIDVERHEWAVLQGLDPADWAKIQQVVLEVHSTPMLAAVRDLLTAQGFTVAADTEALLAGTDFHTLYARRPHQPPGGPQSEQTIRQLARAVTQAAARAGVPYVVLSCPPAHPLEATLAAELRDSPGVYLVTVADLLDTYPVPDIFDPHANAFGHIPYTPEFFTGLATMVARKCYALRSRPLKVIALDCDGTLWQGICAEDGPQGVRPHDALQKFMVAQVEAGMLLCLVSKNDEADVLAVFAQQPAMPLNLSQVVTWRVNWRPKSDNLREIATELNIGLDAIMFIDDNPVECAEVRANCPAVLTVQLPAEAEAIPRFLQHLWPLDHLRVTGDDRQRTVYYQQQAQRNRSQQQALTFADFLAELNLTVDITPVTRWQRAAQLTQRTNQFNLTTRRRSEGELQAVQESMQVEGIHGRDRFGDYGFAGLLIFELAADALRVDTFLLSCRVLGRGVEHRVVAHLGRTARQHGLQAVHIPYQPTDRNQPALAFLQSLPVGTLTAQAGGGYLYTCPAAAAETITYTPPAAPPQLASTRPEPPAYNPLQAATLARIATDLNDVARIHAQLPPRTRPAADNGQQEPPQNPLEVEISGLWAEVLNLPQVGVTDNFFEVGGTSLTLARLHSRLKTRFSQYDLSPIDLFQYPTVRDLSRYLQGDANSALAATIQQARQRKTARQQRRRRRGPQK